MSILKESAMHDYTCESIGKYVLDEFVRIKSKPKKSKKDKHRIDIFREVLKNNLILKVGKFNVVKEGSQSFTKGITE